MTYILFSCGAVCALRTDRQTGQLKRSTELRCIRTASNSRNTGAVWARTPFMCDWAVQEIRTLAGTQ
ncbi:hypothetical protein M407DRAFT_129331 [Tulasnella calospora MUT 4182]|uniref:Uncharacterized protein n=1 Tax=Tulasnella calospora MUT 4182 TaxID=1051891 RepID=A0A0C3KIR7_9AGAM|nr:hypothetical protein M407DRAFT_129331 [Tulasnella calospora MUT 4182]